MGSKRGRPNNFGNKWSETVMMQMAGNQKEDGRMILHAVFKN